MGLKVVSQLDRHTNSLDDHITLLERDKLNIRNEVGPLNRKAARLVLYVLVLVGDTVLLDGNVWSSRPNWVHPVMPVIAVLSALMILVGTWGLLTRAKLMWRLFEKDLDVKLKPLYEQRGKSAKAKR